MGAAFCILFLLIASSVKKKVDACTTTKAVQSATLFYDYDYPCPAYIYQKQGEQKQEFEGSILVTRATCVVKTFDKPNKKVTFRDKAGLRLRLYHRATLTKGKFIDVVKVHESFDPRVDVILVKLKKSFLVKRYESELYRVDKEWIDREAENDAGWIKPW